ncbi:MAG: aspartate aminotransferase family protein [Acidiferrobacterales bacterium]
MAERSHLMQTYARLPVSFARGSGAWLWDTEGKRYLDAVSGIAVCALGHCHPAVSEALCEQAKTLVHTSNLYHIDVQQRLADRLCEVADMERAFFCNSGAEALETAIKLARLYAHRRSIESASIIVAEGSFHGRTLATLSATGNRKVQAGFEPLVQGFRRVPYDDLDAVSTVGEHSGNVAAVLIEPILGEGGVVVPHENYLSGLRELCDKRGWLLMFDEVQTGMCRTGRWFAHQHHRIKPDVMSLAKALGNGIPIGACLARGEAAELFQPGNHASTFGGNLLACRAALAVVETLEAGGLATRAAVLGERILETFREKLSPLSWVKDIRGKGLMLAIELDRPCGELAGRALERGLLINVTAESVIRLLPPLILSDDEADQIANTVVDLVEDFGR